MKQLAQALEISGSPSRVASHELSQTGTMYFSETVLEAVVDVVVVVAVVVVLGLVVVVVVGVVDDANDLKRY